MSSKHFVSLLLFFIISQSVKCIENPVICGAEFTDKQFLLQSPNFPDYYPSNLHCDYFLKSPEDCPAHFRFDFIEFRLENSVGCVKDRLVIEDQDVFCGKGPLNSRRNIYRTNNGSMTVRFITDGEGTAAGFKILVTRMDCEDHFISTTDGAETFQTSTTEPEQATSPFVPFHLPVTPKLPQCCLDTFNSRRFLITSPNFPNTLNAKQDCSIRIQKADDNICRLRLTFLFFNLGVTKHNNCPYGHLEIDGKLICGCNQDLKLTTSFEKNNFKDFVFKSNGMIENSQNGFVIEVIQDECPTKYYPASKFANLTTGVVVKEGTGSFITKQQYNIEPYIEQARLINQKTEISDSFNSKFINIPKIIKTFYYYGEPDYSGLPVEPSESVGTTFIDTSTLNSIVTNLNTYECANWNNVQLGTLIDRYGRNLQTCKRSQDNDGGGRSDCIELEYLNGYIRSPGYPFFYPKNVNVCYRFKKQTGYCFVRLFIADFQIENSYGCHKDYVLLENGNKYCGKRLFGQYLTIDLNHKNYADLVFVTDNFFCGRGFYGLYHQIPCQKPTPGCPDIIPTTPTPKPIPLCDRFITEQSFVLRVDGDAEKCTFQIRKSFRDVCKINLHFEKFDLYCGTESLVLNKMMLCGHQTGRKISVNFEENDSIEIIYKSSLVNKYGDLKFEISGEQISNDCLYPEPPVQRLIKKPWK